MIDYINNGLCLIIVILVVAILVLTATSTEFFGSTKPKRNGILATSQHLNFDTFLKNYEVKTIPPSAWDYVLFRLNVNRPLTIYNNPHYIILDPIDYIENATYYKGVDMPAGYFCVFTSPAKKADFRCAFDLTNRKVGYFDTSEKKFIDTITFGYRTKATPVALSLADLPHLEDLFNRVDAVVLYIVPKSALSKIIEVQNLCLLDISEISLNRLRLTNPNLSLDSFDKLSIFRKNNRIVTDTPTISVIKMSLIIVTLREVEPNEEGFITRLTLSPETTDPNFRCVADETITSYRECEAPYDMYGSPKIASLMDKPCAKNEDCPFYKANKNYENTRGSCQSDGKCELPLGMRRIGYTKYFARGQFAPFCYQCKNVADTACCESQEAQSKNANQTHLKSADYAFANDTNERKSADLPIYIRPSPK